MALQLKRQIQRLSGSAAALRRAFAQCAESDGVKKVTPNQFFSLLQKIGVSTIASQALQLFEELDVTDVGTLDLDRICAAIFASSKSVGGKKGGQRGASRKKDSQTHSNNTITDPVLLLTRLERKVSRNVSGVAQAYRHFRSFAGAGRIDKAGFEAAVAQFGISASQQCCAKLFKQLDTRGGGNVDLNDFMKGILHSADDDQRVRMTQGPKSVPKHQKNKRGKSENQRRQLLSKTKMGKYMSQIQDKFQQHGGGGRQAMLRSWQKLRSYSGAQISNCVTYTEFDKGLKAMGIPLPPKVVAAVFGEIDVDESGTIEFTEFAKYVFPGDDGNKFGHGQDWQRLGAQAVAARRARRLDKAVGLIRNPDILHATIKRKIYDSGESAAQAFRRFRSASKISGVDGGFVITREDLKRALARLQIHATTTCVEMLFRYMDVDQSGALDFNEFTEAIMLSRQRASEIVQRDTMKRQSKNLANDTSDVKINDLHTQYQWTRDRMEKRLMEHMEAAKSIDVEGFIKSMRSKLGSSEIGSRNVVRSRSDNNSAAQAAPFHVVGRSATRSSDPLPSIRTQISPGYRSKMMNRKSSQVSRKAAASALRAQKLIRDRDPRAAFVVAQASLAPQYEKSPSVLASVRPLGKI